MQFRNSKKKGDVLTVGRNKDANLDFSALRKISRNEAVLDSFSKKIISKSKASRQK